MTERAWEVLPNGNGWKLQREGDPLPCSRRATKAAAIERGREQAREDGPAATLRVRDARGRLLSEWTSGIPALETS